MRDLAKKGCGMVGEASFPATCGCEDGSTWTQRCKPENCTCADGTAGKLFKYLFSSTLRNNVGDTLRTSQ